MATSYGGYMGKVIELDLTTQQAKEYPWTDEDRSLFVGGKIMAARILQDMLTGTENPLSEEAPLIISTGPSQAQAHRARSDSTYPPCPLKLASLPRPIAAEPSDSS